MASGPIDFQALAGGIGVAGAIGLAAVTGFRSAMKKLKGEAVEPGARITGGVIMENTSMLMLSERLREQTEATRENTASQRELAHQVERLRDKMP